MKVLTTFLAVTVACLAAVVFLLLARPATLKAISGNSALVPFTFEDTLLLNGEVTFGTPICASNATWNPAAVGTSSAVTLDVTMDSTYAIGDGLWVSLATSTLGLQLTVVPSGTVASVQLTNPDFAGLNAQPNIATTTVTVCYVDF